MSAQSPVGQHPIYLTIGLQYYMTGRFAALAKWSPMALNLFHHGAEMLMKFALMDTHSDAQLRNLGHNLSNVLTDFSERYPTISLIGITQTMADLDRCEELRYPGSGPGSGATFGIVWTDQEKSVAPPGPDTYVLSLEELDLLFATLIRTIGVQDFFKAAFLGPTNIGTYRQRNLHPVV